MMWKLDPAAFDINRRDGRLDPPFWYWPDYRYRVEAEDPRCDTISVLDPARFRFVDYGPSARYLPLGGRALRTLWLHRREIPETFWEQARSRGMERIGFEQVHFTGMKVFNPHGVLCWFYLRRWRGGCYWGITPDAYHWGRFPAILYEP